MKYFILVVIVFGLSVGVRIMPSLDFDCPECCDLPEIIVVS